ncbi:hypothetical protein ACN20G_03820 [Streptomyces sp. BI20]|uniref:hypothetical protein n=1 Tax=Streptomyces sp. BI20 TaxID=3403460 RepID=UPI003C761DA1
MTTGVGVQGDAPGARWAERTFGDLAGPLAELIPGCIVRAHERALDGHQGVRTQTLEAYGHGLYAAQYEELVAGLSGIPGTRVAHLQSRGLVVVGDRVLYPFRYAKRDVPATEARLRRAEGLRAQLLRRHGPEPLQPALFDFDVPEDALPEAPRTDGPHADPALLEPEARVVILAYACAMDRGVMRLEWGEAEVAADRYLLWHHRRSLLTRPSSGR